jgi:hypothetical protein
VGRGLGARVGACLVALALLVPATSFAQLSEGRRAAQRARGFVMGGRCDLAIPDYDKAIASDPVPALLRERGGCHEKLGHADLAIRDYQAYVAAAPTAADVAAIQQRIAQLQVGGTPLPGAAPAAPAAPPPQPSSPPPPLPVGASSPGAGAPLPASPTAPASEASELPAPSPEPPPPPKHHERTQSDQDRPLSGLELGFRSGFALPLGQATGGGMNGSANLNKEFTGAIPLWFDVGYRFGPTISVDAFFQYAFGLLNTSSNALGGVCKGPGLSCSASDLMFGADVAYHFLPDESFDPWIGLGLGFELETLNRSMMGVTEKASLNGLQFVNVELGGDYKVLRSLGIGPFAVFSLNEYSGCSESASGGGMSASTSCSIDQKAFHEWLTFGLRGVFDIIF